MAKETQKQKIERLEKEIEEYKLLLHKREIEIADMQRRGEDSFTNSPTYTLLHKERRKLELENKVLKEQIEHNKKVQQLKNKKKTGRKPRFTETEIATMQMYQLQGKSMREIAEIYNCSVGLVHKHIGKNEQKEAD